jgi:hypothetical protein
VDETVSDYLLLDFASRAVTAKEKNDAAKEAEESEEETSAIPDSDSNRNSSGGSSGQSLDEEVELDVSRQRTVVLRNLPFSATEYTVELFCKGFNVTSIGLPAMPDNPQRFAGYALVTFDSVAEATAAASALDGAVFQGRTIATRQHLAKRSSHKTSGLQDASRYYVPATEASKRGASHGMGGKGAKRFPCFLCATEGHQASDCPGQVCFRCQRSGHQAAQCPPKQWGRVTVCSLCAESSHETGDCPAADGSRSLAAGSECLVCRMVHLPWGEALTVARRGLVCGASFAAAPEGMSEVDESRDVDDASDRKGGNPKKRRKEAEKSAAAEKAKEEKAVVFCLSCGDAGHTSGRCKFKTSATSRGGGRINEGSEVSDRKRMKSGESSFRAQNHENDRSRFGNAPSPQQCFACMGYGHISRDCQAARQGKGRGGSSQGKFGGGQSHRNDRSAFLGRFVVAPEGRQRDTNYSFGKGKGRR